MSRFVESIRLHDGLFFRLSYHQSRVEAAFAHAYPRHQAFRLLEALLSSSYPTQGLYKCRVVYDSQIRDIQFQPYAKRNVSTLKVIETTLPTVDYKETDREELDQLFGKRGEYDDVLLVREGLITDTWAANVALYDGEMWYTPRQPLLMGTHRNFLLEKGLIEEKDIALSDLKSYQYLSLINAMLDLGEVVVSVQNIIVQDDLKSVIIQ